MKLLEQLNIIRELDLLRKEVGYVRKDDSHLLYEETKNLALECEDTVETAQKLFPKGIRLFAGPYYIDEFWMLHNIMVDFKDKNDWLLVREKGKTGLFIDVWHVAVPAENLA